MQQPSKHIIVQLIDGTGRALGNMRLPSHLRLDDLERLAFAAGSPSLSAHVEPHVTGMVREHTKVMQGAAQ